MKTTDIETKLATAISNEVPDILDDILSKCESRKENVIGINEHRNKSNHNNWLKSVCATAAAIVVLVGGYLGIGQYQTAFAVDSVITLDVNPSVKLEVNENKKVLDVTGINEDGNSILAGMELNGVTLKGKELEEAVNALVFAMVEEGFLSEQNNSILVSVKNSNSEKSVEIKSQLLISVDNALNKKGIDGAILGQNCTNNEKNSEIAAQYGISEGKAIFIEKIIGKSPELSYDNLSVLNIHDLSLLAEKWICEMDNLTMSGTPSSKSYVSSESAINNACSYANITISDASEIASSIELEDGKLVYDVSVKIGDTKHKYVIDAKTGVIISYDSNAIESGNESNDQRDGTTDITDNVIDAVTDIIDGINSSTTGSVAGNSGDEGAASSDSPDGEKGDRVVDIITEIINKITDAANQNP